jgi:hypothetical protein
VAKTMVEVLMKWDLNCKNPNLGLQRMWFPPAKKGMLPAKQGFNQQS